MRCPVQIHVCTYVSLYKCICLYVCLYAPTDTSFFLNEIMSVFYNSTKNILSLTCHRVWIKKKKISEWAVVTLILLPFLQIVMRILKKLLHVLSALTGSGHYVGNSTCCYFKSSFIGWFEFFLYSLLTSSRWNQIIRSNILHKWSILFYFFFVFFFF